MAVTAYLRVSTDEQDTAAQRLGLFDYAQSRGLKIDAILDDTASGATAWRSRKLGPLLETTQPNDIILIPEISRIERTTLGVLSFLEAAAAKQCTIHIIKQQMVIDATMQSRIITTILALCAEIERDMIRARTKEGMAKAKAEGKILGRTGRPNKEYLLDPHNAEILRLVAAKVPLRAIARLFQVNHGTLSRHLARIKPTT